MASRGDKRQNAEKYQLSDIKEERRYPFMSKVLLEVCCGSADDVIESHKAGADRAGFPASQEPHRWRGGIPLPSPPPGPDPPGSLSAPCPTSRPGGGRRCDRIPQGGRGPCRAEQRPVSRGADPHPGRAGGRQAGDRHEDHQDKRRFLLLPGGR